MKLGIIPAVISPFALAQDRRERGAALFVTGERFDAATALRIGLVHEVTGDLERPRPGPRRAGSGGPARRASREEARPRPPRRARDRATHRRTADERRGPGGPARIPRAPVAPLVGLSAVIRRLLVANRGEIALPRLSHVPEAGIETVGVVTPDDLGSLHARSADATAVITSYLDAAEYLRAARETGADAIHPGYGFLAESADFAEAVVTRRIDLGRAPARSALRLGGRQARREAHRRGPAGVPTLPQGDPDDVGFPLVVKAAAGGGGRGMRVVRAAESSTPHWQLPVAKRRRPSGTATVFCERYLDRPRHVEVQLVADAPGHVVVFGERDCSVQRRHQKIVEESPAPNLASCTRRGSSRRPRCLRRPSATATQAPSEFLVDGGRRHFLELNGRIQVEHPVTEETFDADLIALQLGIANGRVARRGGPQPADMRSKPGSTRRIRRPSCPQAGGSIGSGCRRLTRRLRCRGRRLDRHHATTR